MAYHLTKINLEKLELQQKVINKKKKVAKYILGEISLIQLILNI